MDSGARSCFILICSDGETEIKDMIISRARQKTNGFCFALLRLCR